MIAYKERPGGHYTPQPFARMGLCVLTGVVVLAVIGFGLLLVTTVGIHNNAGLGIFSIVMGLGCYIALEVFISEKGHYRSGVDDALLFSAVLLACIGVSLVQSGEPGPWTWVVYGLLCVWGVLRFGDRLMASCCFYCFAAAIFYATVNEGLRVQYLGICLMAALSLGMNLLVLRIDKEPFAAPYRDCLLILRYASLLTLYGSLNYYFVREIVGHPAVSWFFWATTFALPILYLVLGIRRVSRPALHVGMLTVAVAILTFRYYHPILPPAEAMTLAGGLLIGLAWGLIRFLREPKGGVTSEPSDEDPLLTGVELLAVTQAFGAHTATPHEQPREFGGGSFGGGGAGGDF